MTQQSASVAACSMHKHVERRVPFTRTGSLAQLRFSDLEILFEQIDSLEFELEVSKLKDTYPVAALHAALNRRAD